MQRSGLSSVLRKGLVVIVILAVLTVIEFFIPIAFEQEVALPLLMVVALGKAALIVYYFMHIYHTWGQEE